MATIKNHSDFKEVRDNARTNPTLSDMHAYFNELTVQDKLQISELRKEVKKRRNLFSKVSSFTSKYRLKFKRNNRILCGIDEYDFVYENLRDVQVRKLPNCIDSNGYYQYSDEVFVNPNLEYVAWEKLPERVQRAYVHGLDFTGVEYSCNNAGDGPALDLDRYLSLLKRHFVDAKSLDIAKSLIFLIYDFSNSTTKTQMIVAIARFVDTHYQGNMLKEALLRIEEGFDKIFSPSELQSDNIFDTFRDYMSDFEVVKKSPLYKKCYKLIMYVLAFTLFRDKECKYESLGYTAMEAAAVRMKFHAGPDLVYTICDTISFLGSKGYEIYKNGFSIGVLQTNTKFDRFVSRCKEIKEITSNMDQTEVLDQSKLLNEVETLVAQGDDLLKCRHMLGKLEYDFLSRYVNEIRSIRFDILSFRGATRARKAPFSLLFNGDSGIGKTSLIRATTAAWCNKTNHPNDDEYIYVRNPVEAYWNNFRTYMHTLILDDIAYRSPDMKDSSAVDEIIQVINDVNFVPDQAGLEDKGRIPFRCKLVIATTNTKDLNAYYYFSCPSAVQRRFPYIITPTVKEEYKNPDTGMLDPSRVPECDDDCFPDLWNFKIELVTPAPVKKGKQTLAKCSIIGEHMNMEQFIDWLYDAIDKHEENSNTVEKALTKIKNVTLCDLCRKPTKYCKCLQSATVQLLAFGYWYAWWIFFQEIFCACYVVFVARIAPRIYFGNFIARNINNPFVASIIFNRAKAQIERCVNRPKLLVYFTATAGTLMMIWKMYKTFGEELQGSNQSKEASEERKPEPDEKKDNEYVWYKNDFELTTADVTRTILSSKSLTIERLSEIFSRNCISMVISMPGGNIRESKAFCVSGQLYLTNNHCVPEMDLMRVEIVQQSSKEGVSSNITFTLNNKDVIRMEESDLCLVVIRCLPPKKNLVEYFPQESYLANTHGYYLSRMRNGSINFRPVEDIRFNRNSNIGVLNRVINVWQGVSEQTMNGDCGTILIANSSKGFCIVGIHVLGFEDNVVATQVTRQQILHLMKNYEKFAVSSNPPILQSTNENRQLSRLHPKSVYRYISSGSASVYGSILGFRPQNKTSVEDTPIKQSVAEQFNVNVTEVAPDMSYRPWRYAALDLTNISNDIDTSIVDECADSFAEDIISSLDDEAKEQLHKYDQFTSINGAAGVRFVDKINRNTSAGFPFKRSKKYYINKSDPKHDLQDPVEIDEEIQIEVDKMRERLNNYEMSGCVFNAHLKDEPVSEKKKLIGKTRVFAGANFPWIIIVRIYLLSFVRVLQNNFFIFEAAIGVNHFSKTWEDFYLYLTTFGKNRLIAGDYGKFDKRMSPVFILAAFDVIIKILRWSGNYSEKDLRVIQCLAYDIAFSFQDFNGDLVQFFGGNPSGHPLTVIINGIVNSLYMRYSYHELNPKKEVRSFKTNVHLLTYGDDNIANVSSDAPWFNHTAISDLLSTINVVYTMADKEAKSIPFISIDDCSFLKRTWRFNEDLQLHVGPLEKASIFRSLSVWVRSKTITTEQQLIEIIGSANAEFFCYGKEEFETNQQKLWWIVKEYKLERYVQDVTFISYDDLIERHKNSST